jgi:hypothetical protein
MWLSMAVCRLFVSNSMCGSRVARAGDGFVRLYVTTVWSAQQVSSALRVCTEAGGTDACTTTVLRDEAHAV